MVTINSVKQAVLITTPPSTFEEKLWAWGVQGDSNELREDAMEKILAFKENGNELKLDLSRLYLTSLPDIFDELPGLVELQLGDNQLTSLPPSFSELKELEHLYLQQNPITSLPDSVVTLPKLETLLIDYELQASLAAQVSAQSSEL